MIHRNFALKTLGMNLRKRPGYKSRRSSSNGSTIPIRGDKDNRMDIRVYMKMDHHTGAVRYADFYTWIRIKSGMTG